MAITINMIIGKLLHPDKVTPIKQTAGIKDAEKKICVIFSHKSLLPISEFVLDEKFQRNTSKFAIFYIYENSKLT